MLLSSYQLCGSRLNYKIFHGLLRTACLFSILLVFFNVYLSYKYMDILRRTGLDDLDLIWFFVSPLILVSVAIFQSVWFRKTPAEMRALAIDWFFVLGYLLAWCFGFIRAVFPPPFL